jgi:predicted nucleic acid-binding protein
MVIQRLTEGSFEALISPPLQQELKRVLAGPPFLFSPDGLRAIEEDVAGHTTLVEPRISVSVVRDDPSDNRVLECAEAGDADVIVSGDRHILELGSFKGIPIVTPAAFLDTLELDAT